MDFMHGNYKSLSIIYKLNSVYNANWPSLEKAQPILYMPSVQCTLVRCQPSIWPSHHTPTLS